MSHAPADFSQDEIEDQPERRALAPDISVAFGPSVLRLGAKEWLAVALIVGLVLVFVPIASAKRAEVKPLAARMPYALSEDEWAYRERIARTAALDSVAVLGDSFVWGEYVAAGQTLTAFLNAETRSDRFLNDGLNGAYPLALRGIVRDCGASVENRPVILHCNLLWMSSPERDLQVDQNIPINHARLLPQFVPRIPSYRATLSRRLGVVVEREVPYFAWVDHVRDCGFDGRDFQSWSVAHPYENPLPHFLRELPPEESKPRHEAVPWTKQGIEPQDFPWVELDKSLQWQGFREAAQLLRARGCRLLVLLGPFNEHLLTDASRARFQIIKGQVKEWLDTEALPSIAPAVLPSDEYGDASHPLAEGYARLAKTIVADPVFRAWQNADER